MGGVCFLKRVRTSCPSRRNASADSATPLLASRRAATLTVFPRDRKSTRLNSSHSQISYAVFCLKKKNTRHQVVSTVHATAAQTSSALSDRLPTDDRSTYCVLRNRRALPNSRRTRGRRDQPFSL